jgi:hypothetical protein
VWASLNPHCIFLLYFLSHPTSDRNGAINAYKQIGMGGPMFNNFHHELALQQRKPLGILGFFYNYCFDILLSDGSEDDEYGQNTPGKRKLDDHMQRQVQFQIYSSIICSNI